MKKKILLLFLTFTFTFGLAISQKAQAASVTGWLWGGSEDGNMTGAGVISTGVGWISANRLNCDSDRNGITDTGNYANCLAGAAVTTDDNYGLNMPTGDENVTGYAWSSNIGWINFAPASPYPATGCVPSCPSTSVQKTGSALSGWARIVGIASELLNDNSGGWEGWIKMSGDCSTCPSGYTYYPSVPLCSGNPTCPFGGSYDSGDDRCEAAGSVSTKYKCPPTGEIFNNQNPCDNKCSESCVEVKITTCPAGYVEESVGFCIASATCSSGTLNTATDKCEASPSSCFYGVTMDEANSKLCKPGEATSSPDGCDNAATDCHCYGWSNELGWIDFGGVKVGATNTFKVCRNDCNSGGLVASGSTESGMIIGDIKNYAACYNASSACDTATGDVTASTSWDETNIPQNAVSFTGAGTLRADAAGTEGVSASYNPGTGIQTVSFNVQVTAPSLVDCWSCNNGTCTKYQAVSCGSDYTDAATCNANCKAGGGYWREVAP